MTSSTAQNHAPPGFQPIGGVTVLGAEFGDHGLGRPHYRLQVESVAPTRPPACPTCQKELYPFGRFEVTGWDLPLDGTPVKLLIRRRRYRCRDCKEHPSEHLAWMEPKRSLTVRFADAIRAEDPLVPTTRLSQELFLSEGTIRAIRGDTQQRFASTDADPES